MRAEQQSCGLWAEGEDGCLFVLEKMVFLSQTRIKVTSLHQDANGPQGGQQPVLQRQVVVAMVRVLSPPEGDGVRGQDGGGAHRHEGEAKQTLRLLYICCVVKYINACSS